MLITLKIYYNKYNLKYTDFTRALYSSQILVVTFFTFTSQGRKYMFRLNKSHFKKHDRYDRSLYRIQRVNAVAIEEKNHPQPSS